MIFGSSIKNCKKKYHDLCEKKDRLNDEYYDIIENSNCESCPQYNSGSVKKMADRFINCENCNEYKSIIELCNSVDSINSKIDEYIESTYSKEVFDHYSPEKPALIEESTGQEISWDDAFGLDFNKIPKSSRYSLIGLIEGEGKYTLK